MCLWLMTLCLVFVQAYNKKNVFPIKKNVEKDYAIIDKIKENLMKDNYDYIPSSESDMTFARRRMDASDDTYVDRFNDDVGPVSEVEERANYELEDVPRETIYSMYVKDNISRLNPVPRKKYKMLKGNKDPTRRSGRRQFVKEDSPTGVAVIKMDEGPMPHLRLSKNRRQYMHHHQ